jgi:molybdopterin-guanine dinucleotide biosynthesis protein A
MGLDKAWIELDGQPLIARSLALLRSLGLRDVFISGRPEADYARLQCPVLLDSEPGLGPVAGIERALDVAQAPLLLVLAVDLPNVTADFLRRLSQSCPDPSTGLVPILHGQTEPLAAIYPRRCRSIAVNLLATGRRSARGFAEACLAADAVRPWPVAAADAGCFDNWNTPDDTGLGS